MLTVYTFPTIPCRATVALQEMLHSVGIRFLLFPTGDATQSIYVFYYSLQSYSSSTGDATQSIRFLLFPVGLQQLYRRCYTVYTFPTIPCRATVAVQEMLHSLYVSYYSLQRYSSSTGDATQSIRFLLFPAEIQQLYRRCHTVYTFPAIPHSLYVSCYSLQSYSSSTGDATQPIRFLLFPVELQQLYRRCYTVYTFPTIPCRDTVALQEMLHSLYVPYYSLQSYSSSTGDATQSIRFLLFPVEIQQALQEMLHSLYVSYDSLQSYSSSTVDIRFLLGLLQLYRSYTVYTFPTITCRATVALQDMLRSLQFPTIPCRATDATQSIRFLLFPVELQQLYRRCYTVHIYVPYYFLQSYSSSTGDATQSIRFLLFPVEIQQLYRRCYTVYTFPTIPCRATVALQEMLHSLYISYYSLQRCYTVYTFPVELQQPYRRCYTVYTFPRATGDATPCILFLLFPVELQQLYRRCYTVYTFPTIPCRATVALQEMLRSLYVSYYSLQSYSSSTGDATQPIRLIPCRATVAHAVYTFPTIPCRAAVARCFTVYTFLTIPCRATGDATQSVDLQWLYRRCYSSSTGDATQFVHFRLFPVEIQQLLQSHSSSTGDATQSIRFLLFPVALQQLYRRCCTLYRFPTIPCRATVALQEMLHSLYVSYYCLQSDSSSTGDATQSIRFLLFLVEMLHSLYVPCRATVALQEMLHSLYVSYYSLQSYSSSMLHSLNISYYSLQSYSSTTRDATQSVDLQWLYRRCYTVYTFPTIPCRAKVALQEMLHSLYVPYYSLQRYSSSTGDATQSICFLLFPVELQQLYRRCMLHSLYVSYYSLQSYSSSTGDACYTVYTFPTIPCRATVALQEMLHSLNVSYYSLQSYSSSTGACVNVVVPFMFYANINSRRCK